MTASTISSPSRRTGSAVTAETVMRLSGDLITVLKLLSAMRHQAPRVHPAAEPSTYPILFTLHTLPMRLSALAEQVHSDISTVSRQVAALVQAGLVVRLPDPQDRRASILSLTAEAERVLEQVKRQRAEWFATILHDWTEHDAAQLAALLERLTHELRTARDGLVGAPPADQSGGLSPAAAIPGTKEHA